MTPPNVFVSYSHDSAAHKEWVLKLATDLRANGVDATIDQWDLALGQDVAAFMSNGIQAADRVLLICSELYVDKAEKGSGGVGYEKLIVTAELVQNIDTRKFVPVVRGNPNKRTPVFLGPRLFIDFSDDAEYGAKLDELLRELLGVLRSSKPPLGPNPFSGTPPATPTAMRVSGPTGRNPTGGSILSEPWFEQRAEEAQAGLKRLGIIGAMELRFGLHDPVTKSQIELLNAVRKSEIRTFGWPIGITLENRDEYRPRPVADGIRAEIAIPERSLSGTESYDYWSLRTSGDFYLLQSLFEDQRATGKLFFNTRIVRVAESLMFASSLYQHLGSPPEARLSVRVSHRGLRDRELSASSANRHIIPSSTQAEESEAELVLVVGDIRPNLVKHVQRITAPMFMLFDFQEFADTIYSDIVTRFERGEVT